MFWSDIHDCTGISVLARYGCSCTTVGMTIMRMGCRSRTGKSSTGLVLLLLLSSGISVPGILLAIPWCVLLWHTSGLVVFLLLPVLSNLRQNWCVVMCLFSLWWQRLVRGTGFLHRMVVRYGAAVRMVVRTGGVSKSRNIKTHTTDSTE